MGPRVRRGSSEPQEGRDLAGAQHLELGLRFTAEAGREMLNEGGRRRFSL